MSVRTYREAVLRLREALDLLGPYRGPCGFCDGPDARHRVADAITGQLCAGADAEAVAGDYVSQDQADAAGMSLVDVVNTVAIAVMAADPRRHWLTRERAVGHDRVVYADLLQEHEEDPAAVLAPGKRTTGGGAVGAVRYRKRPVEVEAMQWTGDNLAELQAWTAGQFRQLTGVTRHRSVRGDATAEVFDHLHDRWIPVWTGDSIVCGVQGEHYPVTPEVLAETYELVNG